MKMRLSGSYKYYIFLFFLTFFLMNVALFVLRWFDSDWWALDYQIYTTVDPVVHLAAFLSFVIYYFSIFFLVLLFFPSQNSKVFAGQTGEKKKLDPFLVTCLLLLQAAGAIFFDVGVAGEVGEAPVFMYFLFLISFDFFYLFYALHEKRSKYLIFVTSVYVFSNVVRGWASFLLYLVIVFWVRRGGFKLKFVLFFMPIAFVMVSILLHIRDIFRGGFSAYDRLVVEGYSDFELLYEYLKASFVSVISRFDLYSHYVGVTWMNNLPSNACLPLQENIIYKIYSKFWVVENCVSLGSILPSFLYDFFIGKGTSFSIGSGFFALNGFDFISYLFSVLLLLLISLLIIRFSLKTKSGYVLASVLVLYVFAQGWNYQFVYMLSGLLFASFYYRLRLK